MDTLFILQSSVLLIARILFMAVFLYFGIPKIKDLKANAVNFTAMGFKPGIFWGTLIALLEVVGGVMIGIGLLSTIPAILFAVFMLVGALWKITQTDKKFTDWSFDLLLFALSLIFVFFGTGLFSVNFLIF